MRPVLGLVSSFLVATACVFSPPVDGPVVRPFAPQGPYAGHWGVDLAVPVGTPVRPVAPGVVNFSGRVAGMESITVDHGGGLRTSYSYLTERFVVTGERVERASVIASSGIDHGIAALHLSARLGARYVDPARLCGPLVPSLGLRLAA